MHILVVDDEQAQRKIMKDILLDAGYEVDVAKDGQEAIDKIRMQDIPIVLTDLKMPVKDGFDVLAFTKDNSPGSQVIIMTAFGTIPNAVAAIKSGAYDYLTKPFKKEDLLNIVRRAEEKSRLLQENRILKEQISEKYNYANIIGSSPSMQKVYALIERIKNIDANVLISGESGTGKEMVARAIHYSGKRKDWPFVAINCGAIPENLIESELFGHEKGSFTGAHKTYIGKFEQAQKGTIFLDEIGTMRSDLQIRLLRVLQEKQVQRVGSDQFIDLDVRVISATNEDLKSKTELKGFREDLYHRLNVFNIDIDPLRDRFQDIALLAKHFLNIYAEKYQKSVPALSKTALELLEGYDYPGNVRELENIIEKTIILTDNPVISEQDLVMPTEAGRPASQSNTGSMREHEIGMINQSLKQGKGSIKHAAESLGISYKTLQYRLKKYGIDKNQYK